MTRHKQASYRRVQKRVLLSTGGKVNNSRAMHLWVSASIIQLFGGR